MDVQSWINTREVLSELENLLKCGVCQEVVRKASTLGGCEHFFCRDCTDDIINDGVCPTCRVPSHAKDAEAARQLDTAAMLCRQLSRLIGESETQNTETSAASTETSARSFRELQNLLPESGGRSIEAESINVKDNRTLNVTSPKKTPEVVEVPDKMVEDIAILNGRESKISNKTKSKTKNTRIAKSKSLPFSLASTSGTQSPLVKSKAKQLKEKRKSAPLHLPATPENRKTKSKVNSVTPRQQPWMSQLVTTPVRRPRVGTPGRDYGTPGASSVCSPVGKKNKKGETPLQVACIKGDHNKVKELLADGAEPNTRDNAGWTPLHEACNHGFHSVTELLLDAGAVISMAGGSDNDTPLHDAVSNYHIDCVRLLVSRGASLTQRNLSGKTPLDLADNDAMKQALQTPVLEECLTNMSSQVTMEHQQVVIVTTGLDREMRNRLQKCAQLLNGKFISDYSKTVSHIVTAVNDSGQCPRTMKYLQGVVNGRWIVNIDWVETCLEYKEHISEEPFEVPGASTSPNSFAPSKARENRTNQLPGLFTGCHFYLLGEFEYPTPAREDLTNLIKSGNGVILTREPRLETIIQSESTLPYHMTAGSQLEHCTHFIIQDGLKHGVQVGEKLARAPPTWILDCVAYFRIVDLPHLLTC